MTGPTTSALFDPLRLSESMAHVAERSQKLVLEFLTRTPDFSPPGMADANVIGAAFLELTTKMMADPTAFATATGELWVRYAKLWQQAGSSNEAGSTPTDRRFRDQAWADNAIFEYIKQTYLISAEFNSFFSSFRQRS